MGGGHRRLSGSGLEIGGPLGALLEVKINKDLCCNNCYQSEKLLTLCFFFRQIEERKQKMICISCVFSIYIYLSISIHILLPKCDQKRKKKKKQLLRKKKSAADDICDDFKMTLLHTYIGHDLISRTVSLHYSSRSKIYCNVLIKLYHTTAHHRKENKRKKLCHQKNQSIFLCAQEG